MLNNNWKNNFLVLGKGPTQGINDSTGSLEKKLSINFSKANKKYCLSLHYNSDESYLYVNTTGICKFKTKDNIRWYNFYLGSVSKDFTKGEQSEISLNCTVYDFSADHCWIRKEDTFNIHQYLMIKNNIKSLYLLCYWAP